VRLRRTLRFNHSLTSIADQFLSKSRPTVWQLSSYATVAIHVRRGDLIRADKQRFGYVVPPAGFYLRAARKFLHRYDRVLFVVSTDDPRWARAVFDGLEDRDRRRSSVVLTAENTSPPPSPEMDMAVLSQCRDGAIVSTGTFGWWAAWISDPPVVIYFAGTPRRGSKLANSYHREDHIPPNWRPLYWVRYIPSFRSKSISIQRRNIVCVCVYVCVCVIKFYYIAMVVIVTLFVHRS